MNVRELKSWLSQMVVHMFHDFVVLAVAVAVAVVVAVVVVVALVMESLLLQEI